MGEKAKGKRKKAKSDGEVKEQKAKGKMKKAKSDGEVTMLVVIHHHGRRSEPFCVGGASARRINESRVRRVVDLWRRLRPG